MPQYQAAFLGKWGFLADIVQLAFGSAIGLIVVGVLIGLFVLVYIYGKVLNNQEARENAGGSSPGAASETGTIDLTKSE